MNKQEQHSATDIFQQAVSLQKRLTSLYNEAAGASNAANIRQDFLNILMDEHQLQEEIKTIMQRRGMVHAQVVDNQKISRAQQEYQH